MPTAHARVEAREFLGRLWPAVERACGWSAFTILGFDEAQMLPRASGQRHGVAEFLLALRDLGQCGLRGENLARVPRAERVIEQEVHHVVFGEQLRDSGQFIGADFLARSVDLILPLRLPELIAPAEAVVGGEHLHRQAGDEMDERLAVLHRQFHRTRRVVGAEDFWQLLRSEAGGNRPRVLKPDRRGEFLAIVQRHGHSMLRRDEEIVLQEKAGEEQPMPLVVGELLDEMLDLVSTAPCLALAIPQLFGLGAEFAPQVALRLIHVPVGIWLMDGERFERLARAALGDLTGLLDRVFQLAAEWGWNGAHRITGPSLSFSSTCSRASASHCSSSVALWMVAPGSTTRWALGSS